MINLVDYLIPPLCEGCSILLKGEEKRLCRVCLLEMEPFNKEGRCPLCFSSYENICSHCQEKRPPFDGFGAVWSYQGAPMRLIKQYKSQKKEFEIPLFANYLLMQFDHLGWPFPDFIITPPQDPIKRIWKRFDPMGEIGKKFAAILSIPLFKNISKVPGRSSQGVLSKLERLMLSREDFYLKSPLLLHGKRLLLLDDVCTTGATLKSLAEALWTASPHSIYALTLAFVEPC